MSSKSSPNLASTAVTPTKDLNKKDSFQYWKQKDISSQISYPSSPDGANTPPNSARSPPTSPVLNVNNKSKSQSSIQTGKVGSVTTPPTTSPTLHSVNNKSQTTSTSPSKLPTKSSSSTNNNTVSSATGITNTNTASSNSHNSNTASTAGSQTMPSRMKSEGRKSIKSIFSLVWSPKPEDGENGEPQLQMVDKTTGTTTTTSGSTTTTTTTSKDVGKPTSKPKASLITPSKSKQQPASTSTTSTQPTTTTTKKQSPSVSPPTQSPALASSKKAAPTLPPRTYINDSSSNTVITNNNSNNNNTTVNNSNENNINSISNSENLEEIIDVQINKLKGPSISDTERLLQLEVTLSKTNKLVEDLAQRLTNEIMSRRELESHCNELEARLKISEARLNRYSHISLMDPSSDNQQLERDVQQKESQIVQKAADSRDDSRFNTLTCRIDTFEHRMRGVEENNLKLNESVSTLQFEQSLFTSEKRKKALKKLEKEKEKEKEQRERESREREKEKLRSAKKEKKEREKEYKRQFYSDTRSERSYTATERSYDLSGTELSDSDTDTCTSEILKSSLKRMPPPTSTSNSSSSNQQLTTSSESYGDLSQASAPSPKKVAFSNLNDGSNSTGNGSGHPKSKSTGSYSVSLRKWAGKRMSAHVTGTDQLENDDELSTRLERANTTAERSQLTKGYFADYYDGNVEDLKNQKLTRMRSKSLSRDSVDDEDEDFTPKISISTSVQNPPPNKLTSTTTGNQSSPSLNSLVSSAGSNTHQSDEILNDKKKLSTIGRMFGKKEKPLNGDRQKVSLLLSERLNHRASRDELIIKKIMKAESIFAINVTEDTLERLTRFLENCFEILDKNCHLEDLFTRKVEESSIRSFKESIEQSIVSNFNKSDPYLVAATLLNFFESIPDPLLGKAAGPMMSIVYIDDHPFRCSLTRSIFFSLPPTHRTILKMIVQFIQNATNLHQQQATLPQPLNLDDSGSNSSITSGSGNSTNTTIIIHPTDSAASSTTSSPSLAGSSVTDGSSPLASLSAASTPLTSSQVIKQKSKLTLYGLCATFSRVLNRLPYETKSSNPAVEDREVLSLVHFVEDFDSQFDSQPDIQFIIKDISYVKHATFEKLFERLIDLNNRDTDYNYTIFYTYDYYFKSPTDFLERMIYYFKKTVPVDESVAPKAWQTELSLTVLSVGMFWMKLHQKQLSTDLMFLSKLKSFIELHAPPPGSSTSNFFNYFKSFFQLSAPIKTLYERGNSFYSKVKKQVPNISVVKIKDENDIDIYQIGAQTIASQLTIIDMELFTSIPHLQFLHKAFTKPDQSPEFHHMVDRFNQWAKWTSTEILSKEKVQDRVLAISFFIEVAKNCVEIGNYNCAAAIVGGLNHSSISRLKNTWDKLPAKTLSDYKALEVLFDMSMNYKNYREALKASSNKVVPYLAIYPKDLIAIEEANDTFTPTGMINIEKFRLIYRIVKELQLYHQVSNLKFQLIEPVKKYLLNITSKLLDEKELHAQSLKVEPRQPSNN